MVVVFTKKTFKLILLQRCPGTRPGTVLTAYTGLNMRVAHAQEVEIITGIHCSLGLARVP